MSCTECIHDLHSQDGQQMMGTVLSLQGRRDLGTCCDHIIAQSRVGAGI
jgi:hypothetical protein